MKQLLLAAALVAGSFIFNSAASAADKLDYAAMDKLGWKLSIQCWTFNSKTMFEVIDIANSMGVRYIEAIPGQKISKEIQVGFGQGMSADATEALQKKLKEANVQVVAFGVVGVPGDEKGARKMFEWAKQMGIEVLNTESMPNAGHDKLTEEFGIRYALHNHPQSWPPDKVLDACKDRCKMIGSCSDTGHWRRQAGPGRSDQEARRPDHEPALQGPQRQEPGCPVRHGHQRFQGHAGRTEAQGFKGVFSIKYEHWDAKLLDNVAACCKAFSDAATELAK